MTSSRNWDLDTSHPQKIGYVARRPAATAAAAAAGLGAAAPVPEEDDALTLTFHAERTIQLARSAWIECPPHWTHEWDPRMGPPNGIHRREAGMNPLFFVRLLCTAAAVHGTHPLQYTVPVCAPVNLAPAVAGCRLQAYITSNESCSMRLSCAAGCACEATVFDAWEPQYHVTHLVRPIVCRPYLVPALCPPCVRPASA